MATTIDAPAKLTVSLRVTGVRPDGYHELEAEMVSLDLADTLVFAEDGDGPVALQVVPGSAAGGGDPSYRRWAADVPTGEDNLVTRALAAVGRSASVRLVKRIPPGAGLGGGSADAAAVLRWAGCADGSLAASLGADVPFCLMGGRALVTGAGETVVPLPWEERTYTLLLPPFGMDTAAVYRTWDDLCLRHLLAPSGTTSNDLEAAAVAADPRLIHWREALADATGARPRLAGSGSTWFVEGGLADVGLGGRRSLTVGRDEATLVEARTTRGFGCQPDGHPRDGTRSATASP